MARKQRDLIVETPEVRQAESGRPVLSLLVISLCLAFLTLAVVWYVFFRI